jgi:hypothetical protein
MAAGGVGTLMQIKVRRFRRAYRPLILSMGAMPMSAGELAYLFLVLGAAASFVATLGYVSMTAGPPKQI